MVALNPAPRLLVRCLNCGGSDQSLALIGVIIALIALGVAVAAMVYTGKQHAIAQREHVEFMKQLNARARFQLTARVLNAALDGALEIAHGTTTAYARIEIGLTNTGEKSAGPTTIKVLLPGSVRGFRWLTSGGTVYGEEPVPTSEVLTLPQGGQPSAQYLSCEVPRVSNRTPVLRWIWFSAEDHNMSEIPIRVTARSDDLDIDEASLDHIILIRWLDS